ncbi:gtp-binding protein [Plasmopara halstedii]|uniref:Gtp-binding protein n=1 Tax=Plasmopara halstedii TaxID=4781 RepID=A0A0P1B0R2_PLAHL|nr:gtp-binding protein [Plasmopara halstedii]CEG47356.1 gtp-binding protein [Plasmopara halstedii]|eukprot:XP_024583725.1 gtp-binding protein [Plasmopara halstedii]
MDELQSVGFGIALGIIILSILTVYPGEPFDYSIDLKQSEDFLSTSLSKRRYASFRKNEREDHFAVIDNATERVRSKKLKEPLDLENDKTQQLMESFQQEISAAKTSESSPSCTSSKSAWLYRIFILFTIGFFVWIFDDFSLNVFVILKHIFPKEAQAIHQVATASYNLWATPGITFKMNLQSYSPLRGLPRNLSSFYRLFRPYQVSYVSTSSHVSSSVPVKATTKKRKKQMRLANLPIFWPIAGVDEPPQLRPHEVNIVNRLFKEKSTLITSTSDPNDLPDWNIPEIAFAGRSNAGKSSLINALTGQKTLLRTSKTPGRTQQLHFLSVGGKKGSLPDLSLVDMPGFGFATAPKKVVDEWHTLVGGYIDNRRGINLKTTMLLIDARRGIGPADHDFMDFLHDLGALYQVVFTKVDTVTRSELEKQIDKAQEVALSATRMSMNPIIQVTSVKQGSGIKELQRQLVSMTGFLQDSR